MNSATADQPPDMSDAQGGFWRQAGQIGCGIVVVLIGNGAVAAAFLGGRSSPLSSRTRFDEMEERPATKEERTDVADVRKRLADLERGVEALEKKERSSQLPDVRSIPRVVGTLLSRRVRAPLLRSPAPRRRAS